MAASFVRVLGTAGNEVSSATLVLTLTNTVPVGDCVVVMTAHDNSGTSGAAPGLTLTDSKGNTWSNRHNVSNDPGLVNEGLAIAIHTSQITTQLVSGDTITMTYSPNTAAKTLRAVHLSGVYANELNHNNDGPNFGTGTAATSDTITEINPGSILIGMVGVEGGSGDSYTEDSDTQDGSWTTLTRISSGNNTTSSITNNAAYKLVDSTPSGSQTYNGTLGTSRDWAASIIEFQALGKAPLTFASSTVDAASYVTASITPPANTLILLAVSHGLTGGAVTTPTATGNGLTWTQVTTIQSTNIRTTVFKAYGASPTTGAITIDFAGNIQGNCAWNVSSFPGYNDVVQSNTATGSGTPATVTLSSGVTAGNATYGVMAQNVTTNAIQIDSDFETVGQQLQPSAPSNRSAVQWDDGGENPIAFGVASGAAWHIVGVEIRNQTQAATATFSGTGSFTATGKWTAQATATFSGTGSVAATATVTRSATASFSGAGSFTGTANLLYQVEAWFGGIGAFSLAGGLEYNAYSPPFVFVYLETEEDVWVACEELRQGSVDRGRQKELDKFKAGSCILEFNNEDRRYDPTYADGPFYGYLKPNRRMKVEAFQNDVTYPIFFGYIDSIDNTRIQPKQNIATFRLSDAFKVLNKATVNGTDFSAELPGERIETVLDLIPIEAGLRDIDTGTVDLQALTDVSSTLLSHVQTVEITEFGALFVQADGVIRFKDQDTLRQEPQQAVFGDGEGEFHYRSISAQYDDSLIRNPVSVDRIGGTKQTVEDTDLSAPPPDGYGNNHFTLSGTYHDSDADALVAADLILSQYREPKRRITGMTVGPVEYEDGPTTYPHLLGRELTDSIIVIERPQGVGDRIEQKSIIEGIRHSFSPKNWVTTWSLSPSYVPDASFSGTSSFIAVATAAPQWRSVSVGSISGAAPQNSLTMNKPTSTVAGDLLVAFITVKEEGSITKPDGWTQIRSTDFGPLSVGGFRSYYKVAGASEPSNYTWVNTDSDNTYMLGVINRITGADTVNPINTSSQLKHSSGTDATGDSVTTTVGNCLLIFACALWDSGAAVTPPSGMSERWDFQGGGHGFEGATVAQATAGASGDKVSSHANADNAAHLIAIAPA